MLLKTKVKPSPSLLGPEYTYSGGGGGGGGGGGEIKSLKSDSRSQVAQAGFELVKHSRMTFTFWSSSLTSQELE